ncbi:unnamed protein product [Rangifer tarandus platyrhynchus]|uniref:Uncharacterized protein n=1 Tax=Rangifer tarandus platyrhynchus TaxID=3082113 RepID=A0ABN8YHX4_RANTA|nr:unnamed protein product [Rangifer tarandus platyrhynchus]
MRKRTLPGPGFGALCRELSTRVGQGLVSPQLQGRGPQTCCPPRCHHARSGWVGHAVCTASVARVSEGAGFIPRAVHPPRVIKQLKILTAQPDRRWKHSCVLCGKSELRKRNWALKGQARCTSHFLPAPSPGPCSSGRHHLVIVTALSSIPGRSLAPVTSRSLDPALYAAEGRKETTADVLTREGAGVGAEEVRRDAGRTRAVSGRLPAKHSLTDRKAHGPRTGRRLPGARDGAGTGRRVIHELFCNFLLRFCVTRAANGDVPATAPRTRQFSPRASAVGATRFAPDSARTASAQTHRADPQEALVVLARMRCREKRAQRLRSRNLSECNDMGPLANAVGGNDPDIQEDPRSVQPGAHPERGAGRLAAGGEHGSVSQTHGREAASPVGRVSSRRRADSRQTPRCPRPHPASTSGSGVGGEPRGAQGASGAAQPLRSRLLLLLVNPQRTCLRFSGMRRYSVAGSTSKGASTAGRKVSKRGRGTRHFVPSGWGWGHVAHSAHFHNSALLTQAEGSC